MKKIFLLASILLAGNFAHAGENHSHQNMQRSPAYIKVIEKNPDDCADASCRGKKSNTVVQQKFILDDLSKKINTQCEPIVNDEFLKEARAQYQALFPKTQVLSEKSENFLNKIFSSPKENLSFKQWQEINFCGESDEAQYMELLLGEQPSSTWKNAAKNNCSTTLANKSCVDAKCSLRSAYGSEEGALLALIIAKRDGYAMSIDKKKIGKIDGTVSNLYTPADWSIEELRTMNEALQKLPATFKHLKGMKSFFKYPDEYDSEGADYSGLALLGQGETHFMPSALKSKTWFELVVIHELAHHQDYQSVLEGTKNDHFHNHSGFAQLSGWVSSTKTSAEKDSNGNPVMEKIWTAENPQAKFVRDYAAKNPDEDYADSIGHYVSSPTELLIKAPEKYEFIKKNIFQGKEFLNNMNWPALARELKNDRAKDEIIKSCMENISYMSLYANQNHRAILFTEKIDLSYTGIRASDFFNTTGGTPCFAKLFLELSEKLQNDPKFCVLGGNEGLEKTLMNQAKYPLDGIMKSLQKYVSTHQNDTSSLAENIRANPGFDKLLPETQNLVINTLTKLVKEAKIAEP